jgi:GAF domain-containing protein
MARPSKAGGKTSAAKGRKAGSPKGRKRGKTKRRIAPAAIRSKHSSVPAPGKELKEAREQQAATDEILQVIASSPGDLKPVFDAILENATRLCEASHCHVWRFDGGLLHAVAVRGDPWITKWLQEHSPIAPIPGSAADRIARGENIIHVPDRRKEEAYSSDPLFRDLVDNSGVRASLSVSLRREGTLLGMINVYRQEARPFSDRQIALLQNFAAQAVIAMENARLLNELRQRTSDLTESLEQQIATGEVLKAISRSAFDLQPVFNAIADNAVRLCEAERAFIFRFDGHFLRAVAHYNVGSEIEQFVDQNPIPLGRQSISARAGLERRTVHVADVQADSNYAYVARDVDLIRTMLAVPMLKDDELVGTITIYRHEVKPFTDKQVALVETFAAQAVIAVENTRLLNELRESLQQQTATADVLKVISRSAFDLHAVLGSLTESAARLCDAEKAFIFKRDGDVFRFAASFGFSDKFDEYSRENPMTPGRGTITGRAASEGRTIHIPDVLADAEYEGTGFQSRGQYRTGLGVPLLREGETTGVFGLTRTDVRPFTDKQIELVTTFADQAAIAIQNAKLFEEVQARTRDLQESLEYQTATADVLKVISRSTFDLRPVLATMAETAARLCEAEMAFVSQRDGDVFRYITAVGSTPEAMADAVKFQVYLDTHPISAAGRRTMTGRVMSERQAVQIADITADVEYNFPETFKLAKIRTLLGVPLMRENEPIGVMNLARQRVEPFTERQIELVRTFADQAVIAIENTRLLTEQREALERQTATAEVLEIINSCPGDLTRVFEAMLEKATLLCGSGFGTFWIYDGERFTIAATHAVPTALDEFVREPVAVAASASLADIVRGQNLVQMADMAATELYHAGNRVRRAYVDLGGARTAISVALRKDNALLGAFNVYRQEVRPFSNKEIALVQNFAAQAVIAIENARLLNELRESLEQQTATSDVLQIISSSPGDLAPVFQSMLENATRICGAKFGLMYLHDGGTFRSVAHYNVPAAYAASLTSASFKPHPQGGLGTVARTHEVVHIEDMRAQPPYLEGNPSVVKIADLGGARTTFNVPMLKENELIGAITIYREEVRPFTNKQIELVKNFAKQAVIAIENTRLLKELRQRTEDLSESLQQQTATSDVLKVISRSTLDLETVLDALVETVARLCRADQANMFRWRDDMYHLIASHGLSQEAKAFVVAHPFAPGRGSLNGRVAMERQAVHIQDVLQDPEYLYTDAQKLLGFRTMLGIPLLREDTLVGIFSIHRTRVEPFTDKEIELATTFADQAVIAIENTRLFEELGDRQAELRVTFDNMGDGVAMFGADTHLAAFNRNFQEMLDLPDALLTRRPSFAELFRYLAERGEFGSTDLEAELSRSLEDTSREMRYERTRPDGRVIEVRRNPVPDGGFVLIYADITERKRAEEAIRAARDAAEKALRDLQTAQDRLVQTEKLASLGQLTAGIAHEIKNPLNFVNNFSAVSAELVDEMNDVLEDTNLDEKKRKELDEIRELLKSNLEKVVQHGKRADSIVKNMLLHSRSGSGEHCPVEINVIVEESLNLAYHGARAEGRDFNITLERDFDQAAGVADIYPQEITRVLLNLISNGLYAATKRAAANGGLEPKLKATTRGVGDKVEIRIRDNGIGIPSEIREKIFNPFFTTKPAGEGTGLGLSMSHDIIVKQHDGTIEVATEPGIFTEFIITLPRVMPVQAEAGGHRA